MMEHVTDGLQLYLKMNELQGDKVPDSSGHERHGKTTGKPTVVDDPVFGTCLRFSKDDGSVMIDDVSDLRARGELTFSAWIRLADDYLPRTTNDIKIFRIPGPGNSSCFESLLFFETTRQYVKSLYHSNQYSQSISRKRKYLDNDQWVHITTTVKLQSGRDVGWKLEPGQGAAWTQHYVHLRNKDGSLSLVCGGGQRAVAYLTAFAEYYSGFQLVGQRYQSFNFSHVRFYDRALSQAEIENNVAADLGIESIAPQVAEPEAETKAAPLSAFRAEYPIDLNLYDDDHQSVLYIEDGHPHQLNLELHNRSGRDINFNVGAGDKASVTNHHLELKFRPGTLSTKTLQALKNAQATVIEKSWERSSGKTMSGASVWDIGVSAARSGVPVSVYLLCKGGTNRVLGADSRCVLSLLPMAAAAQQGTRGTQVTLKFNEMTYTGPDRLPVTGQRTRQLYVTHAGRRDLPVHVGFIGSNRIHTGSQKSELTLRITNTHKSSVIAGEIWGGQAKLILRFDYGDDEWALCKAKDLAGSVTVAGARMPTRGQGIAPEWDIPIPDKGIAPGQHKEIKITFTGATVHGTGNTNLYLGYENIPGYADGQIISTIERTPMSVRKNGIKINGELSATTLKSTEKVSAPGADFTGPISTGDGAVRWIVLEGKLPDKPNGKASHGVMNDEWIVQILEGIPEPDKILSISGRVLCNVKVIDDGAPVHGTYYGGADYRDTTYTDKMIYPVIFNSEFMQAFGSKPSSHQDALTAPIQLVYKPKYESIKHGQGKSESVMSESYWQLICLETQLRKINHTYNNPKYVWGDREYKLMIVYNDTEMQTTYKQSSAASKPPANIISS